MPELTPQQKAQLDSNIKAMLKQGASEDDVISYSNDFRAKYDIKKKELGSSLGGGAGTSAPLSEKQKLTDYLYGLKTEEEKQIAAPQGITTTLKQKPKQTDEKALEKINTIMYEDSDRWKDPVKSIIDETKNLEKVEDLDVYNRAAELTRNSLAGSGYKAKTLLADSFLSAERGNLTADMLQNRAAQYDKVAQPFRELGEINYTDQRDFGSRWKIQDAAIKAYANKNPLFAKQMEAAGIDLINGQDFHLKLEDKTGQVVNDVLNDEDFVDYIQNENPNLYNSIKLVSDNLLTDNKAFGANVVANEISRARLKEGFNNPIVEFDDKNFRKENDLVAESLYRDDPQKMWIYQNIIANDPDKYIDTPNLLESGAHGAEGVYKGIGTSIKAPFQSTKSQIKESWKQEANNVTADPKGINKFLSGTGHVLGLVGALGGVSNVLGAGGAGVYSSKIAPFLSGTIPFAGDFWREGITKYPDSPVKAGLSAGLNTILYGALSQRIFPTKQVQEAFTKVRPEIGKVVENLASGKITREVARQEANTLLKKGFDLVKGGVAKSAKISAELTGITAANRALDKLFMEDADFEQYHTDDELGDSMKTLFLDNLVLGGITKYSSMRKGNKMLEESLYEAATNPLRYKRVIDEMEIKDPTISKDNMLSNLGFLSYLKMDLDSRGISEKNQKRYLLEAAKERAIKQENERVKESGLSKKNEEGLKIAEEVKEAILKGEDADTVVTSQEQKEIDDANKQQADKNKLTEKGQKAVIKLLEEKDKDDKPTFTGMYRDIAKNDPLGFLQEIADQVFGMERVGGERVKSKSAAPDEAGMVKRYSADVVNAAKELFPLEPEKPKIDQDSELEVGEPPTEETTTEQQPSTVLSRGDVGRKSVGYGKFVRYNPDDVLPLLPDYKPTNTVAVEDYVNKTIPNDASVEAYKTVPIDAIKTSEKIENKGREEIDKIKEGIKNGDDIPPVVLDFSPVIKNGERYQFGLMDGHHRYIAYKELGVKEIPAAIVTSREHYTFETNDIDVKTLFKDQSTSSNTPSKEQPSTVTQEPVKKGVLYQGTSKSNADKIFKSGYKSGEEYDDVRFGGKSSDKIDGVWLSRDKTIAANYADENVNQVPSSLIHFDESNLRIADNETYNQYLKKFGQSAEKELKKDGYDGADINSDETNETKVWNYEKLKPIKGEKVKKVGFDDESGQPIYEYLKEPQEPVSGGVETENAKMDGVFTEEVNINDEKVKLPEPGFVISDVSLKEGKNKGVGYGQELYKKALDENGVLYSFHPISEDALRVQDKLVEKGVAKIETIELQDGTFARKIIKSEEVITTNQSPSKNQPQPEQTGGGEPPVVPPIEGKVGGMDGGSGNLDKLANNVPDSGKVSEYLSGETIEKYTGEAPMNDQTRGVQELEIALNHGEKIIEEAQKVFGEDYVEKTLNYIDQSTAGISNKALMYVSLENALGREKLLNPDRAADIAKQQKLVYEKSQAFARQNSLALNYQRLRKIAEVGYDMSRVTDNFFSSEEKIAREVINKATEANGDLINEEYAAKETGEITPEVQKMIEEGIAKEVAKLYEQLPKEKKSLADRAIKALEAAQAKLRSRTYDAGLGIPVAVIDAGITVIKNAIKAGVHISKAIELGINKIKERYGKELSKEREDRLRADLAEVFEPVEEYERKAKPAKDIVKEALIEKGFGREITVNGQPKQILDWKKLAGEAGLISNIRKNVDEVLKEKGLAGLTDTQKGVIKEDFLKEYVDLRQSIIEKAQNELARRNKETVTPEQKSAAKKLSELYTYGLFDSKFDEYENVLNKALGAKVSEQGFNDAKAIAKAMDNVYKASFKGVRLNDISAKSAIEKLEDQLRILLYREAKVQGNFNLKAANIVRTYFETSQTMLLNNMKQAMENPFSGLSQNVMTTLQGIAEGSSNKELRKQQRAAMKTIYKDMVINGGITYGKVESQFVNRQHLDDLVNKMSDNKLYHGIASTLTGKATLNAMDAMFKSSITEKKFTTNLITVLTHETNPKRMSKEDAMKFVTEKLTGQTFEEAKVTAKQTIEKINHDAGKELIPVGETQVNRLANDIVKASLEMGGKITGEQIAAAYNAAYKSAGLNLGHEANNPLSGMIKGYSAKLEGDINRAIKEKEWNRAAFLTYKSVLFRNILNPFVGGGTNWLVLKMEKTGLGLFTGLAYQIGSKKQLDLSTKQGLAQMQARLYNQARYKDSYVRGIVGGITTWSAVALFKGLTGDDDEKEYRKWRGKNQWAARYLDVFTPEPQLAEMGIRDNKFKQYVSRSFNRGDAFDPVNKIVKGVEFGIKGERGKMWGAFGEGLGMKINSPVPWRLAKDLQVIYQGVTGQDPYHGNYKPSNGFLSGVLQGGVIEWAGGRPIYEDESKPSAPKRAIPQRPKPVKQD